MSGTGDGVDKVSPEGEVAPLPQARDEEEEAFFGDDMVPKAHRNSATAPEHHARYRWAASLVTGKSVLDVGCGTGAGAAMLAGHAARVVGIDVSTPFAATAAERYGDSAEFRVADVCRLPFEDGDFDAVVCFETIEQVTDLERALLEMRRVLVDDGLLLISCANSRTYPAGNPFHRRELTSAELSAAVGHAFSNVTLYRQHRYLASLLGDEAVLTHDEPVASLDADLTKTVGTAPGAELYAVALASDGELPRPSSQVSLGTDVDQDEERRLAARWRERAAYAETDAAATRFEIDTMRAQLDDALARAEAAERALRELERR